MSATYRLIDQAKVKRLMEFAHQHAVLACVAHQPVALTARLLPSKAEPSSAGSDLTTCRELALRLSSIGNNQQVREAAHNG